MDIDLNVENYSLSELFTISNITNDNEINEKNILFQTNELINQFKKNPQLSLFFKNIQNELIKYVKSLDDNKKSDAIYPAGEKQISDWYNNENLTQKNQKQVDKITQRQQKIDIFGNQHVPMNREQLATTDTYNLPVKQDSLNPNLKNTINRFVNLDSQFRQYTSGIDSTSTNYIVDLSDTLKNVLSLRLYSYQIPYSWYVIDNTYGNTCFWIVDSSVNVAIPISIAPGNYTQSEFVKTLNQSFNTVSLNLPNATFEFFNNNPYDLSFNTPVYFNPNNGIITLYLYPGKVTYRYKENNILKTVIFDITPETTTIVFYDFTGVLQCNLSCTSNHFLNNSLGWIMGYKLPYFNVNSHGNVASSVLDLNGTKYLILVLDDYNQNHVNNSLVSIAQYSNTLKIPSYYSSDLPYTCLTPSQKGNNLNQLVNEVMLQSQIDNQTADNGLLIAGKYQENYTSTQIILPSAPRTLTQAQIYTINQIKSNDNNLTNYLVKAPTSSDILAILPVKTSITIPTGSLLVEFSGSLQDSSRIYFGPVNIERMAVKLLDDKGNILNLNGNDWVFTLVCECLYQY